MVNNQLTGNSLEPTIITIFGITGDLAKRKVLPAIYHLLKHDLLPDQTALVGTSRREIDVDELLKDVELCILENNNVCDPDTINKFRQRLRMVKLDPVDGNDYDALHRTLDAIEDEHGVCMSRLFYLSIPPQVYGPLVRQLGEHGLNNGCQHDGNAPSRLLVEKPFGYDLASAEELISETGKHFKEDQVFRIDHYLAKETAQNILTFRRYNPLFAAVWSDQHIRSINVTAAEKISIEGRANFYEQVGAMRDLIQSHLLQLLALVTMELPGDLSDSAAIHNAKHTLLAAVTPPAADHIASEVTRAQYDGYRDEVQNADSSTETFVSIPLTIAVDRWQHVPIRLTTGKALDSKRTDIVINFGEADDDAPANRLTIRVQPNDGIDINLVVKKPGFAQELQTAKMDFSYQNTFDETSHPDAYERVLVDAVRGDHMLFATSDEVLDSWKVLQPILDQWQKSSDDLRTYAPGAAVNALLAIEN